MPTAAERRALTFLATVACLGAAARVHSARRLASEVAVATGQSSAEVGTAASRALAAQLAAVDSARAQEAERPRRQSRRRTNRHRTSSAATGAPTPSPGARQRTPKAPAGSEPSPTAPLDVNSATAVELEQLPRIGPALAQRIVAWRERHGPYDSIDALRHVPGIGVTTAARLAPLVTFSSGYRP